MEGRRSSPEAGVLDTRSRKRGAGVVANGGGICIEGFTRLPVRETRCVCGGVEVF